MAHPLSRCPAVPLPCPIGRGIMGNGGAWWGARMATTPDRHAWSGATPPPPGAAPRLAPAPVDPLKPQDSAPEGREPLRIMAVDNQLSEPTGHYSPRQCGRGLSLWGRATPPVRNRYDHQPLESII